MDPDLAYMREKIREGNEGEYEEENETENKGAVNSYLVSVYVFHHFLDSRGGFLVLPNRRLDTRRCRTLFPTRNLVLVDERD